MYSCIYTYAQAVCHLTHDKPAFSSMQIISEITIEDNICP